MRRVGWHVGKVNKQNSICNRDFQLFCALNVGKPGLFLSLL